MPQRHFTNFDGSQRGGLLRESVQQTVVREFCIYIAVVHIVEQTVSVI